MRRILMPICVVACLLVGIIPAILAHSPARADANCGLQLGGPAAFCDTFDAPAGIGNRSGDLDGTVWGVSRTGEDNIGGLADTWYPSVQQQCGITNTVLPESSITLCNGLLTESLNDHGNRPNLAMYPRQPFDIAGRTGTVSFDVSNNSEGDHAAWPEFWYTDQPVPAPSANDSSSPTVPRNGIGIRFDRICTQGPTYNYNCGCPTKATSTYNVWNVATFAITTNYVNQDIYDNSTGGSVFTRTNCVTSSTGPGNLNHVEVRLSAHEIDVYATDAGTVAPLKEIATLTGITLPLTRGLIWLEDTHYNGNKTCAENGICQKDNTLTWDNAAFDGPVLPRDLGFDVNDSLVPSNGGVNLGWNLPTDGTSLSLPTSGSITGANIAAASGLLLTFNYFMFSPLTLTYSLNGNAWHDIPWPYPDQQTYTWRTLGVPANLSELVPGVNTIRVKSAAAATIANVDLILVGAGGIPGTPTATGTPAPPTATPTATSTPGPATGGIAIDAGGPVSQNFVADTDYAGGGTYAPNDVIDTSGVANPAPQTVYSSGRFGNFTYTIPNLTPGGAYTVRLSFAETWWGVPGRGVGCVGKRIQNVTLQGTVILPNFDICQAAGGPDKAVMEQFSTAADGTGKIAIQFATVADNAFVSGIEVFPS